MAAVYLNGSHFTVLNFFWLSAGGNLYLCVSISHWLAGEVFPVCGLTAGLVQAIGVVFTEYLYPEAQARGEEGRLEYTSQYVPACTVPLPIHTNILLRFTSD